MKDLPEEFDPDNPPDRGLWAIYEDGPPEPPNQEERLQTVHKLGLLDAPEDPVLNSICDVTCSVLQSMVSGEYCAVQLNDPRMWKSQKQHAGSAQQAASHPDYHVMFSCKLLTVRSQPVTKQHAA